eukprot:95349-Chlamydomonas_euryale.AAC.1
MHCGMGQGKQGNSEWEVWMGHNVRCRHHNAMSDRKQLQRQQCKRPNRIANPQDLAKPFSNALAVCPVLPSHIQDCMRHP